jgi:adenosylcobinamide amidohydrolase
MRVTPIASKPVSPSVSECGRWLWVDFDSLHVVKSWAVLGGGTTEAKMVAWHQVSDRDLGPAVDPHSYLAQQLQEFFGPTAASRSIVAFLTGTLLVGRIECFLERSGIWARCIATVGLNNALRIGDLPNSPASSPSTINILLQTSVPLTDSAAIEAVSIVAEARTVAVLKGGVQSTAGTGCASGTGTDCIAVAAPATPEVAPASYTGKHTLLGHLIGAATYQAVETGVRNHIQRSGG